MHTCKTQKYKTQHSYWKVVKSRHLWLNVKVECIVIDAGLRKHTLKILTTFSFFFQRFEVIPIVTIIICRHKSPLPQEEAGHRLRSNIFLLGHRRKQRHMRRRNIFLLGHRWQQGHGHCMLLVGCSMLVLMQCYNTAMACSLINWSPKF